MAYLDKQLMQGETVAKQAHLHWIVYLPAIGVGLLALAVGFGLGSQGEHALQAAEILGGALGLYALYLAFGGFLKRSSARFAVTNKRILIRLGMIRRQSSEILLSQIEGITVHQGLGGRLFNYGTVVIEGTGGDSAPYRQIAAPDAFRLAVQEQIEHRTQPGGAGTPSAGLHADAAAPAGDRYAELLKLDELRQKGILSEAEFQAEKRKRLDRP